MTPIKTLQVPSFDQLLPIMQALHTTQQPYRITTSFEMVSGQVLPRFVVEVFADTEEA